MAKPPHRMGEINMYMKLHYDTRIKAEADRRLEIAQRQYDAISRYRLVIRNHGEQRLLAAELHDAPHLAEHSDEPHV